MSSDSKALLRQARQDEALGRRLEAMTTLEHAASAARTPRAQYDALMLLARMKTSELDLAGALDVYWKARNVTKKCRLGRTGDADLGIGMVLLDLDRVGEGLEAVRRAVRYFRQQGNTYHRACSETVLAEQMIHMGDFAAAGRHLDLARDLFLASGEPRMLASVATLRAEMHARKGESAAAESCLSQAVAIARAVTDDAAAEELRAHRAVVRALLPGAEPELREAATA